MEDDTEPHPNSPGHINGFTYYEDREIYIISVKDSVSNCFKKVVNHLRTFVILITIIVIISLQYRIGRRKLQPVFLLFINNLHLVFS